MPWFLLVGADDSGKRTVLSNNGLPQPFGPAIEVDSQRKDAGKWWVFDDAVVLEAPAAAPGTTTSGSTLPPDQTVYDASVGWHTLLHMSLVVELRSLDSRGARTRFHWPT